MLRRHHDDNRSTSAETPQGPRLNLLLSYGGWQSQSFAEQLPRLLEPMGVRCVQVGSGQEATQTIQKLTVHIAVVDLAIPLQAGMPDTQPAGPRVLQLLRRLDQPPPTVVVRPPQASSRESARTLADALREGAFAVLDRPVQLEAMLEVLRRILRRHYANNWPKCCDKSSQPGAATPARPRPEPPTPPTFRA
jgi:CheY-like chemotaxis protein